MFSMDHHSPEHFDKNQLLMEAIALINSDMSPAIQRSRNILEKNKSLLLSPERVFSADELLSANELQNVNNDSMFVFQFENLHVSINEKFIAAI